MAPACATRLLFSIGGKTIHGMGQLHFDELHEFPGAVKPVGRGADAGRQVIDLGSEGGHAGGEVVVTGTPEDIAACNASHTGRFLKAHMER